MLILLCNVMLLTRVLPPQHTCIVIFMQVQVGVLDIMTECYVNLIT